jgi:septal ring factor EnvC (AmiA/AmiB activator)
VGGDGEAQRPGVFHHDAPDRLESERARDWQDLSPLPESWLTVGDTISLALATSRASELAAVATLQTQLSHVTGQLQAALERANGLAHELEALRTDKQATEAARMAVALDLERARADIARLEGVLSAYSFGWEKPVNVGLIMALVR